MKRYSWALKSFLAIFLAIGMIEPAWGQGLPILKGKKVVATVSGEAITLDELNRDLAFAPGASKSEVLGRLINVNLVVQEARRIGLDELPEIKNMVDAFSKLTLREELMERRVEAVKVDEKEAQKLYNESVKEWKISSIMVEKESDAKRMIEA